MTYTVSADSIQSSNYGYLYSQSDEVTVASGVLVSSTGNIGVFCGYASSQLINNGHIFASDLGGKGIGVQFDQNDGSVLNAAGASVIGMDTGVKFFGDGLALTNHGTIRGLRVAGVVFAETAQDGSLDNAGWIVGRQSGIVYSASSGAGEMRNSGAIKGNDFGVLFDGSQSNVVGVLKIVNANGGTITGGTASIGALETEGARVLIDNRGTLNGPVLMGDSDASNVVVNRGTINGKVSLGNGNDVFNGAGGRSGPVFGGRGDDTLAGGSAADRLSGSVGADTLTGRGGADRFVFDTALNPATNTDTIRDFAVNVDKIVLFDADDLFAAAGPSGMLAAARFHIGPAAADASDRIIYNPITGALFYDHDGRGGDPQLRFAQLAKHLALDHADFVIAG